MPTLDTQTTTQTYDASARAARMTLASLAEKVEGLSSRPELDEVNAWMC